MNKRAKGKLLVNKAKAILERDGWMVQVCSPRLMFVGPGKVISKEEDFFGAWDIWAIKKLSSYHARTLLIQVSMWNHRLDKIKQVKDFPDWYGDQRLWLWKGGRGCHFRECKRIDNFEWDGLEVK